MARFLSESYDKPKLIEKKIITRIINDQNNKVTFETMITNTVFDIVKKYYKIILGFLLIFGCLYWRYIEIQKKRNILNKMNSVKFTNLNNYNNIYEEDSEDITSEEN